MKVAIEYFKYNGKVQIDKYDLQNIDWGYLFELSEQQKMTHLIYYLFKNKIPDSYREKYKSRIEESKKKNQIILNEIKKISTCKSNIKMIFIKGIVLSYMLYGDPYFRISGDIDVLINEVHIDRIHELLLNEGFFHACGKKDVYTVENHNFEILPFPILKDHYHHEYFEYYKNVDGKYVTLELQRYIHQTIVNPNDIHKFLEGCTTINIDRVEVITLDIHHMLIYLIESAFTETSWYFRGPRIYKHLELALYISKYENQIDWEKIFEKTLEFQMSRQVYVVLNNLNEIFGHFIDDKIIKKFANEYTENDLPIQWKNSIKDRMFESFEERSIELINNLKKICFNSKHKHKLVPLSLGSLLADNQKSITDDLRIYIPKYNIYLTYLPTVYTDNLLFTFDISDELFPVSSCKVVLEIIDPHIDSEKLYLYSYYFTKQKKGIQHSDGVQLIHDGIIQIKIPLKDIVHPTNQIIAYQIKIQEQIYGKIHHYLTPDGYTNKSFWLSPTLLKIQSF